jgi:hypothetical protein
MMGSGRATVAGGDNDGHTSGDAGHAEDDGDSDEDGHGGLRCFRTAPVAACRRGRLWPVPPLLLITMMATSDSIAARADVTHAGADARASHAD